MSQLVLLRGRREIGVGVVATSDERGRSSLDGAADFIRPLSSTARNICLRLRLFVGHFCSAFCVAATRPVTRWNTTRSPVPLYSLFSRKRGTRVIHAHANARNVTFEPSLGAGKKASRLSEICQITFLDDPIKWLNGRTGIGTESRRAEGRIYPFLTNRSNSNIGVSIFVRSTSRVYLFLRVRRGSVIEDDNASVASINFLISLFLSFLSSLFFYFARFSPAALVPKICHAYPISRSAIGEPRSGGDDGCAR